MKRLTAWRSDICTALRPASPTGTGPGRRRKRSPQKCSEEGVRLPFDGLECPVPADYDGYLTCLYGDYRQLPPPEKRISHHETAEIRLAPPDSLKE